MDVDLKERERSVRTLIVSDVHLGCRFAQADNFLTYLSRVRPEQLFILGDFLDGWELKSRWRWKPVYSQIIDRLFDLAERGTELFYTPGNHDQFLRCPEVARLLRNAEIKERLLAMGIETASGSPDQFATQIRTEIRQTRKLLVGLKIE